MFLLRMQQGEREALSQLYDLTAAKLLGIALRIVRRRTVAEDVLQDAFIRIWQNCQDYSVDKGSGWAWMTTIVRNRAIDVMRRDRGILRDPEDGIAEPIDPADGPLLALQRQESAQAVWRCLEKLPVEQRRVILIAYFEGQTHEVIARRVAAPLGTVKTWIRRGLLRIRECLQS